MFGVLADVALISEFSGNRTGRYASVHSNMYMNVHIVAIGTHVHIHVHVRVCLLYCVYRR